MLMESDAAAAAVPSLITHPAHPEHALKLVATGGALFQCDGCRQLGPADERRYRCDPCDFDLHECCAPQQPVLTHPLLEGQVLAFLHSPPAVPPGCSGRSCDACGEPVLGFLYHNGERQTDLHPQCASLPERIIDEDDGGVFELCVAAPVGRGSCGLCGQGQGGSRARFWCYRYNGGDGQPLYMHMACIMEAACSRGQVSAPVAGSGEVSAPATVSGEVSAPATGSGETLSAPATGSREVGAPGASSRRSGKFKRFCKVAWTITEVTNSIASLDPVGVITAIADSL